jgi:macrolide transport system ATP-binding/permease protein
MKAPLLEMWQMRREYQAGSGVFLALDAISFRIFAGEFVAIIGTSGSGKSTLMNLLGCLDRATSGRYTVAGQDVATMDADRLSALRQNYFGFIFQRYNLLPGLSALENVELPAVYAGQDRQGRRERAAALLGRLGLGVHQAHRPTQLSGGQQQRVSIARALINGGQIVLADEPTGALDSRTGAEVMALLKELNSEGHTVIVVTHDPQIAACAERVITLADGRIIADCGASSEKRPKDQAEQVGTVQPVTHQVTAALTGLRDRSIEALRMALLAMNANRLRTALTMLGIVIGIASVASVVALGQGGQQRVLAVIRQIGTNTIDIHPGIGWGDQRALSIQTLTAEDAAMVARLPHVDSVTPFVMADAPFRSGNVTVSGEVNGVGDNFFRVHAIKITAGRVFSTSETLRLAQVVVIDGNTSQRLFASQINPIGQVVFLGTVPFEVIGVAEHNDYISHSNSGLDVWAPYTAVLTRMLGKPGLHGITARVSDDASPDHIAKLITKVLIRNHGRQDFFIYNTDTALKATREASETLAVLISSIAVVSLIVGGVGVMNIMLVSVTERTREIGVRVAVGARRSDILWQFMIEAVLVCAIGGVIGVFVALIVRLFFGYFVADFQMIFSWFSILLALTSSLLVGLFFGYIPARNAARLDPVEALSRE